MKNTSNLPKEAASNTLVSLIDAEKAKVFGLTPAELAVFSTLADTQNIEAISQESKISRTGTIYNLNKLVQRGLVERIKVGKRHVFKAIPKEKFASRLYIMADEFHSNNRNKKSIKIRATLQSEFSIFVGIDELLEAHEQIASENKNERLFGIQPNKSWKALQTKVPKAQFIKFNEIIRENNLIMDAILAEDVYEQYRVFVQNNPEQFTDMAESLGERMADYVLVGSNFFNHGAELWLYKNTVFIINWEEEIGIRIENKDIRNLLKDMYDSIKASGKKVDHNEMIRKIVKELQEEKSQTA